ncbi:MAG: hypothetical protein AAGG09_10685 [Pseudomonadota bacterium]
MSAAGADAAFIEAFDALPLGTFEARFEGARWVVTRSRCAGGRSEKLVGEAADGSDDVSMNVYRLSGGARLAPCEMSVEKARAFVMGAVPLP